MLKEENYILNNSIEGIIIIENGFIKDVNETIVEILKYNKKEELIGNLATGILIPNNHEIYISYNKSKFQEISLVSKNSDIIPAVLKIKAIDENIVIAYILDLSDFKEKETLLQEQSRMAAMGEMISMIAHQWRQPLSALSALSSTLRLKTSLNTFKVENLPKKLDEVDMYISYMSKTIDDFRNFFKRNNEKQISNIYEVVKSTLNLVQQAFENKNIHIVNNTSIKPSSMYMFKNELNQVVLNILSNSKDAFIENNTKNPKIEISYDEDENFQYLNIEDNAGGIKQEILNKVFDPYFSTKDEKNGTGLGLYMSQTIINKHFDGKITVENTKDGAKFIISMKK